MMLFLCFFLGAILGRCITFFRGSPIEPPRVQHEKPFLDNPRKAHHVYQEWLEEKNIIRLFTPFQALPPPFRKKKAEKLPLPCSVGPGKFVLNGAGFNIFSQVPLGLNLWLPRGGIGGPGIPLLRQRQWPLTAFRVVRIICNKGKEQKLVDIDKYEFCSEIAYSSQEDSQWGGISMDAQWHDVPNPAILCESSWSKAKLGWLGHIGSEQPPCFVGILEIYDLNRTVFWCLKMVSQTGPNQQRSTNYLIPIFTWTIAFSDAISAISTLNEHRVKEPPPHKSSNLWVSSLLRFGGNRVCTDANWQIEEQYHLISVRWHSSAVGITKHSDILGTLFLRFDFFGGFKAILTDGELATQSREGSS